MVWLFLGRLKFIILYNILCKLDQSFSDPEGLYDLEIGAQGDQHAQKLLYVMKFADIFIAGLAGDDEILEGEHRELIGNLDCGGIGDLHLHKGVFCLQGGTGHAVSQLSQGIVVIAGENQGERILLRIVISLMLQAILDRCAQLFLQIVHVALCLPMGDVESFREAHSVRIIVVGDLFMKPLDSCVGGLSRSGFHSDT